MRLTQNAVAALTLPAGKTDVIIFDDAMPGFGHRLRLGAGGKVMRSWIVQYKHAGTSRRLLLGSGEVLKAEQARTMAKRALGQIASGTDPQADRQDRRDRDRHTLRSVVTDFLEIKQREVRPRSFYEMRRYLTDKAYFGPLHSLALDQIGRADVASRLNRITLDHTATVCGRARSQINGLFVWAMQQGLCDANPIVGTAKPKNGASRTRVLSDAELAAIWQACGADDHGKIVKLLILTGARRAEIGGLRWPEFDFEAGTWTLPAERSKNKTAHSLPLLPMMAEIIDSVPRIVGHDQLFGLRRAAGFSSWARAKDALDARLDLSAWTVHDIRRTTATRMADLGIMPHIIEQILNHQSGHKGGIAGIYNRSSYEREVRAALATWHDHIRTTVEGGKRKIITMPRDSP